MKHVFGGTSKMSISIKNMNYERKHLAQQSVKSCKCVAAEPNIWKGQYIYILIILE